MKWETRFSRLNLIIEFIFTVGKKGQLGKKFLFRVLHVYDFPFLQLSTNFSYKPYLILRHQLLGSPEWLPESNKSDRNRTGDPMSCLASLNSIPPSHHDDHLYIFIQIIQYGLYRKNLPYFITELFKLRFMSTECRPYLDSLTMLLILHSSNF